jgi:hypothetical protein
MLLYEMPLYQVWPALSTRLTFSAYAGKMRRSTQFIAYNTPAKRKLRE